MMKQLTIIFSIAFSSICVAQSADCDRSVFFGNKRICLPHTPGMEECYDNPTVKSWADLFKGNPQEEILGLYIKESNYQIGKLTDFEEGINYPYVKVYSTQSIAQIDASMEIIDIVAPELTKTFDNWTTSEFKPKTQRLFDNLSNKLEMDMSLDSPILIDEYQSHPSARSFVVLMNFKIEDESFLIASVLSLMIIEERLIFCAYYDEFKGSQQLDVTKAANDFFVMNLMAKN